MKKIVLIVFILFPLYGLCQKNTTVSGYIFDAETNEPLIGANIFEVSSKNGTISNEFGFYSLSFPKNDSSQLIISFIGYNTLSTKTITSDHFSFYLIPGIDLEEVTVSKNKKGDFIRSNETGIIKTSGKTDKRTSQLFW